MLHKNVFDADDPPCTPTQASVHSALNVHDDVIVCAGWSSC